MVAADAIADRRKPPTPQRPAYRVAHQLLAPLAVRRYLIKAYEAKRLSSSAARARRTAC
jgi:hypothetical protein